MNYVKLRLFLLSLLCIFSFSLMAQTSDLALAKAEELRQKADASIRYHRNAPRVKFIRLNHDKALELQGNSVQEKAGSFLREYGVIYGIESVLQEFNIEEVTVDKLGYEKVVMSQHYEGVPVFDAKLVFHFNPQKALTAISGNYIPKIKVNASPVLSNQQAGRVAVTSIEQGQNTTAELKVVSSELFVFNPGLIKGEIGFNTLAYEIEARNDQDIRQFLFVDARTGEVVERYEGICTALDREVYESNSSNLVWEEGDAFPGTLSDWQQNEVNYSGQTYYFFKNAFDYISYDNNDATMKTINNASFLSCPNASWNGSTANYCDGTASDDVIGHEWGHAYTEYTNGLIYAWQSGAINESYSDIWGETIDQINEDEDDNDDEGEDNSARAACNEDHDRWKMGEGATGFSSAIRDMWLPSCKSDPDEVSAGEYVCGSGDSGGVHSNSGVPNHLYALLVDGGTHNGYTINAIGFTKAAHIFWRAQLEYLSRTSDFEVLADALQSACADLESAGTNLEGLSVTSTPVGPSGEIITAADCAELDKAILAVELSSPPSQCNFIPMLDEVADVCDDDEPELIHFAEDWESGSDGWTITDVPSNPSTWETNDWSLNADLPDSRAGQGMSVANLANGNCNDDLQNGIVRLESPIINISPDAENPIEMTFDHFISLENRWDGGNLKYSINGGAWSLIPSSAFTANTYPRNLNNSDNPLGGQAAFTGADGGSVGGSWGQSQISLDELGVNAGDEIKLRWELGTDGCNGWDGWYLDEISVYSCRKDCIFFTDIPTETGEYTATSECTNLDGWTHYISDNGTADTSDDLLLLSIQKNDQDIGTVGDGTFVCTVTADATTSKISAPYVSNPEGWWTMNRYWNITPTSEPTKDVEIRFYYTQTDYDAVAAIATSVSAHEDMYFWKINDVDNAWDIDPKNGHKDVPLASAHALDGYQQYETGGNATTELWRRESNWKDNANWNYAEYTVGHFGGGGGGGGADCDGCFGALPVSLGFIKAEPKTDAIKISWQTLSELNNAGFELERSVYPDKYFERVYSIDGAGTQASVTNYQYLDQDIDLGKLYYYRLKQLDVDGSIEYSHIVSAKINTKLFNFEVYPNPANSSLDVRISGENNVLVQGFIYDLDGSLLSSVILNNESRIDLQGLSAGVYIIKLVGADGHSVRRFVKQ